MEPTTRGPGARARISVEVKASDCGLLQAMQAVLPWRTTISYRTRSTNFAASASFALGLPVGRKSTIIAPPSEPFSHSDYFRGLIDADGSVGFTFKGVPFVSLVTASAAIAEFTCAEILAVTGAVRTAKPNKRDGVVNLMVSYEAAAVLAEWLYRDACIALDRKRRAASDVAAWERPATMRAANNHRRWTDAEDDAVLRMPIREAAVRLGRTEKSVNMRRWRLRAKVS
jgi:hypothetical protein